MKRWLNKIAGFGGGYRRISPFHLKFKQKSRRAKTLKKEFVPKRLENPNLSERFKVTFHQ